MRKLWLVIRWLVAAVLAVIGSFGVPSDWATADDIQRAVFQFLANPIGRGVVALAAILTVGYCLGDSLATRRIKRLGPYAPANFAQWDKLKNFPVWQVAWLWIGLEPTKPETHGTPAYPVFRRLKEDLAEGRVKDAEREDGSWLWTALTRQALMDYAVSIGERPFFLFPKQRSLIGRMTAKLSSREIPPKEVEGHYTFTQVHIAALQQDRQRTATVFQTQLNDALKKGEVSAIGRKLLANNLLGPYERIPRRRWRKLVLDWGSSATMNGAKKFVDVRFKFTVRDARPARSASKYWPLSRQTQ